MDPDFAHLVSVGFALVGGHDAQVYVGKGFSDPGAPQSGVATNPAPAVSVMPYNVNGG